MSTHTSIWTPLNQWPRSTAAPFSMISHDSGVLTGLRPSPQQFDPSQNPPSAMFPMSRHVLTRVNGHRDATLEDVVRNAKSKSSSSGMASDRTAMLRFFATGKSSLKIGLPIDAPYATKSYDKNTVKSAIKRARSSGSVVPPKARQ